MKYKVLPAPPPRTQSFVSPCLDLIEMFSFDEIQNKTKQTA